MCQEGEFCIFFKFSQETNLVLKFTAESKIIGESDDDDVSEGEFIASCWNSSATPVRSALKSPDKATEVCKLNPINYVLN